MIYLWFILHATCTIALAHFRLQLASLSKNRSHAAVSLPLPPLHYGACLRLYHEKSSTFLFFHGLVLTCAHKWPITGGAILHRLLHNVKAPQPHLVSRNGPL